MIEIEKKFMLTPVQLQTLVAGATDLGRKVVEDRYFDTPDYQLTTHDLWLRLRDGNYELKIPPVDGSGSYDGTNRYHELEAEPEILNALKLELVDGDFGATLAAAGISRFVTCFSDRQSYEKDGFKIDIDNVSYADTALTHSVAEIELLVEDDLQVEAADARIVAFAKRNGLSFDGVIQGKVAAYLQAERPAHYDTLIAAGVLK